MSKGINKFIGIGNCCADPETRYAASGAAITNISIACNDSYKDKNTGKLVDKTEFVRVVFFNRLGEIAGEYLKKGSKVYIEGSLRTRKWQNKDGVDMYTTEIVASEMQMLDSRETGNAQQSAPQNTRTSAPAPVNRGAAPSRQNASAPSAAESHSEPEMDSFDDLGCPF